MAERIPLLEPDLRGNEAAYLAKCIEDGWVSSAGGYIGELEARMAALAGCRHGVATSSGTTALHLALVAVGVGPGDRVIVPDWTFAATANAVYHAGATPYFVDIAADTWSLSAPLVEELLSNAGSQQQRIAAVICVHALGHPAEMDPLIASCRAAGVPLIEDAACAVGASYRQRPAGGLGDAAIFSFNGNKTVTAGGGGMIVTDNGTWVEHTRQINSQARVGDAYAYDDIGFNHRMTNLNAAVGLAQLERLDEMLATKREIAALYRDAIAGRDDLLFMPETDWAVSSCWVSTVVAASPEDTASLIDHFDHNGIDCREFWRALSDQAPYREAPRRLDGTTAALSGRAVSLPSSSSLTAQQQARVIAVLRQWRGRAVIGAGV